MRVSTTVFPRFTTAHSTPPKLNLALHLHFRSLLFYIQLHSMKALCPCFCNKFQLYSFRFRKLFPLFSLCACICSILKSFGECWFMLVNIFTRAMTKSSLMDNLQPFFFHEQQFYFHSIITFLFFLSFAYKAIWPTAFSSKHNGKERRNIWVCHKIPIELLRFSIISVVWRVGRMEGLCISCVGNVQAGDAGVNLKRLGFWGEILGSLDVFLRGVWLWNF